MVEMTCDLAPDQQSKSSPPPSTIIQQQFENSENFFEGAEKLLEIWFFGKEKNSSLRKIPKSELDRLMDIAGCKILQILRTEQIDSYLLSESSLFVSDRRLILKTCGQTRPLLVISELLKLAQIYGRMDIVTNVYYSRKNFFCPQLHATYLYTLTSSPPKAIIAAHHPKLPDHTLELQMTGIPAEVLRIYSWAECPSGAAECTKRSGILDLLPRETLIQDELFKPVGMNGVIDHDEYVTIHITPEPEFCYASFETNHRRGCLFEQTRKVLNIYKPTRFILTLFASKLSVEARASQQRFWKEELEGYKRASVQMLRLQQDKVLFALFVRDNTQEENDSSYFYDQENVQLKNTQVKTKGGNDDGRCNEPR
uniref:Adenosylmethionine decarboxylase n=1 Tax=Meloidogyne javanica TaxID=6303 RepID=A0A915LQJ4_MELJA